MDKLRPIPGAFCLAALAAQVVLLAGCGDALRPLEAQPDEGQQAVPLPEGTVVLNAADAAVKAPFALREDAAAVGGLALVLPEGAASGTGKGCATLKLEVPQAGAYYGWIRARWSDSCGNSVALQLDDGPPVTAGQDRVFGTWHWVDAGKYELSAGEHLAALLEREDGLELDQLLFTPDREFRPFAPVSAVSTGAALRRFADDFARSPGHGMESWDLVSGEWRIEFSLDPNRIPNQYSLVGEATGAGAAALLREPPWNGCRLSFSVSPREEAEFGALLDRTADGAESLRVGFRVGEGRALFQADGSGLGERLELGGAMRAGQWHRVVIERWAWVARVTVDDRMVLESFEATPRAGQVGLFVASGSAVFDDVSVEQIPWQADDGRELRVPWVLGQGAQWFRPVSRRAPEALIGRRGAISARFADMRIEEIVLEETPDNPGDCSLEAPGLRDHDAAQHVRVLRMPAFSDTVCTEATLTATQRDFGLRRVALRYGKPVPDCYRVGLYHFTRENVTDPSDYLDFTPEEYLRIQQSPEADRLTRVPRIRPLIGDDYGFWVERAGAWAVQRGVLVGKGPNAVLRHRQSIAGDFDLRLRARTSGTNAASAIELCGGPETGARVELAEHDGEWHEVFIRVRDDTLEASVDGTLRPAERFARGLDCAAQLRVPAGTVEFDDIEFTIPRRTAEGCCYAFDRRETDWWREGGQWLDHGGIACVQASNWVSLVAPDGRGALWSKRRFGPDVLVTFDIEENSEWFGWRKNPDHVHHPFDNVCAWIAPGQDPESGYRLEVNSQNRCATVLYRNGEEVARVRQDGSFPIRYVGGHTPYIPRKNRICLAKQGSLVQAVVNGKTVIEFDDPDPVEVSHVAIGGYNTRVNFSHVEVRRLTPGRPGDE